MDHNIKIKADTLRKMFALNWNFHDGDRMVTTIEFPTLVLKHNHIEKDLLATQVMKSKGVKGWLYDPHISYIFVEGNGEEIFIERNKLRELSEECLKSKEWATSPKANSLMTLEDGSIVGFIPLEKIRNIR